MIEEADLEPPRRVAVPLAAEPALRQPGDRKGRLGRLRRSAIAAAALAHLVIIAVLLLRWPFAIAPPPSPPPPIAVALVTQIPEAPPPPAPKPQAALHDLRSGRDQETTAPPQAETQAPEAAAPKPEPLPEQEQAKVPEPAPVKPSHQTAPPRPKEAARETAPQPLKRGSVDRAPGETEREGDPYLNRLWAMIEQHRSYPTGAVGSFGLHLEGTTVYLVALAPTGQIEAMRLERSSGAPILDETARRMIEQAAPFPPLPTYFPRDGVTLSVTIHLFPAAS